MQKRSLVKIYTQLCACCVKPVDVCKRIGRQESQDVFRNRFAALELGTTDTSCDCEADWPSNDCDREGARERDAMGPRVDNTPQLIDDPLGDVFEIHQELQVDPLEMSSPPTLIGIFSGDG